LDLYQSGFTARMPLGIQTSLSVLVAGIAPATDGTGRCLHLAPHLVNVPTGGPQGHRHTTTLVFVCRSIPPYNGISLLNRVIPEVSIVDATLL
jgi:hypothetical protein